MGLIQKNAFRGLRGFLQAGRIHRVRSLHSKGQKSFLWELRFDDAVEDFKYLASEIKFPGISNEVITYHVGGVEQYVLGKVKRGGLVSISFLEIEGSVVDYYFREWLNNIADSPVAESSGLARPLSSTAASGWLRNPKNGYTKSALVILKNRLGDTVAKFNLIDLIPAKIHEYSLRYEDNSFVSLKVDLFCNEVRRLDIPAEQSIRLPVFD